MNISAARTLKPIRTGRIPIRALTTIKPEALRRPISLATPPSLSHREQLVLVQDNRRLLATVDQLSDREAYLTAQMHMLQEQAEAAMLRPNLEVEAQKIQHATTLEWFQNAPIGFHIIDPTGKILDANKQWLSHLGYEREEVVGKPIFSFIAESQREDAISRFAQRIKGEKPPTRTYEREYVKKDGSSIFVETFDSLFKDNRGNVVGVLTSFQDITERVVAQRELLRAQEVLVEAERLQAAKTAEDAILNKLAHSLNNLIVAINGKDLKIANIRMQIAEALVAGDKELEIAQMFAEIDKHYLDLKALHENLAAITSKILARKEIDPKGITTNVKDKVARIIQNMESLAESKKVKLKTNFDDLDGRDHALISDLAFEDIILNLVKNAIQAYGPVPESSDQINNRIVEITASKTQDGMISIRVSDQGPGIPPEVLGTLFSDFVKSTKSDGHGFGLKTVGDFVRAVGGRIIPKSELGRGTSFEILIPISDHKEIDLTAPFLTVMTKEQASAYTVLILDDDEFVLESQVEMIGDGKYGLGFKTIAARSLAQAKKLCDKHKPDIILTDKTLAGPQNSTEFGYQLIEYAIATSGEIPPLCILCSGEYIPEDITHPERKLLSRFSAHFITKVGGEGEMPFHEKFLQVASAHFHDERNRRTPLPV